MKQIRQLVDQALTLLEIEPVEYSISHPKEESHGDYSVNVAMILAKKLGKNPRELAEEIMDQIGKSEVVERTQVAGPGFINFYLKNEYLLEETKKATESGYGINDRLKGKKIIVEYTDPNPFKEFHIGHLMSNTIGESLVRLFESSSATVKRVCYQGDVGLHVAKSVWGMQQLMTERNMSLIEFGARGLKDRQQFMGESYAYGSAKYEESDSIKVEVNSLNKEIYQRTNTELNKLYDSGRAWSLEYFETIYQRLGTKFDEYYFESEAGPVGLKVVEEGLEKGVLEVADEGAVVYKGESVGLHTRVFRNKLGLPTYEAKDLGLAKTKWGRYKYDISYIVTANEITEYFKVVLKVMSQLYPELAAKTIHMPHGIMKLTTGKMSSRTGKVITGESLLHELKEVVIKKIGDRDIKEKDGVADAVAVSALKYSVLRQAIGGDIVYEPEKMTNLEGNTGPFLQYTYARCSSILRKFQIKNSQTLKLDDANLVDQEVSILRWLYRYPEVVAEAGINCAPHLVATFVSELASRFNSFYQTCRVEENGEVNALRYLLTQATANVLKNGLGLLGIQAPAEM